MRPGLRIGLAAAVGIALMQLPSRAADAPATPKDEKEKATATFKDEKEKASYAIGMYFGNNIKRSSMDVDLEVVVNALKEVLAGGTPKMSDQEASQAIRSYQMESRKKVAEKNKKEGETFLAENKSKPGVKTMDVKLPDGSNAEMQYKVITEGSGPTPQSNDVVQVNYRGTLIDGKEFDSSAKHGGPQKFPANRVVKGWSEALQHMKVGSKWELFIPSSLAYGDVGNPNIEPGSTLLFEVELVGIEPPQAPPTSQPLTSDIIKVPSAEELKKGAKIEVIKPEDAARMANQAHTNAPAKK